MIKASFTIDETHLDLRHAALRRVNPIRQCLPIIFGVVGLLLSIIEISSSPGGADGVCASMAMFFLMLFIFSLYYEWLRKRRRRQTFKVAYMVGSDVFWEFDAHGIRKTDFWETEALRWGEIWRVLVIWEGLIVVLNRKHYEVIPSSAFRNGKEMDAVIELFRNWKHTQTGSDH